MRFVIVGVGAIGGTLAVTLSNAGFEVAAIARGSQLAAIRENGLTLKTPRGDHHARFDCAEDAASLGLNAGDIILLCVKSQDTEAALDSLLAAGAVNQPIFCMQNGVANERMALRYFDNVYAVAVMLPSEFLSPGTICAFGTPQPAIFDIGRYPSGRDETVETVVDAFNRAGLISTARDNAISFKYGKLLLNLRNVLVAASPDKDIQNAWLERARQEAIAAYDAAGIDWTDVGWDDPRRVEHMSMGEIPGVARTGSSSLQSLLRNTGSIETDYLNGEIVMLGRLHGAPTPVNAALCRIARKLVAGELALGKVSEADMEAELAPH